MMKRKTDGAEQSQHYCINTCILGYQPRKFFFKGVRTTYGFKTSLIMQYFYVDRDPDAFYKNELVLMSDLCQNAISYHDNFLILDRDFFFFHRM